MSNVYLCGRGFSNQTPKLHPRPVSDRLWSSGTDTLPRWRRSPLPTMSFERALQKPTGDVSDTRSSCLSDEATGSSCLKTSVSEPQTGSLHSLVRRQVVSDGKWTNSRGRRDDFLSSFGHMKCHRAECKQTKWPLTSAVTYSSALCFG